jgi:DNA-binding HxlR family transcriptional regulator
MHERKIKEDLDCGITIAIRVFGAKWQPCIIDALSGGSNRPSELHRRIPDATPRVLDMQLSELLELGVVSKRPSDGFPLHTSYFLTPLGESIIPIIRQLDAWGHAHKEEVKDRLAGVT